MTTLILRLESVLETTLDSFESTSVEETRENLLQLLRQFENDDEIASQEGMDLDENSNSSSTSLSSYLNRRIPRKGMSLFHLCVGHSANEPSIVQLFLEYGANPNNLNCDEKISPLHLSILYEYDSILELLLRYGGDPFLVNGEGLNSFDLAFQQSSTPALIQILLGSQIIKQLETSSFKINDRGEKRNSEDFDSSLSKKPRRSQQNLDSNMEMSKEQTNQTSQKPPLPPSVIRSVLKKPKGDDCLKTSSTANLPPAHSNPDIEPEREDKASGFRISSRIRRLTLLYQQHQQKQQENQQVQSTKAGNGNGTGSRNIKNNNNNHTPGSVKKVAFQLESEDEDDAAMIINQTIDSKSNKNNNNYYYSEELKTSLKTNEKSIFKYSRLKYQVILHIKTESKLKVNNSNERAELKKVDKKKNNTNNYLNYLLLDPRKLPPINLPKNLDKNQQCSSTSSATTKQNALTFSTFLEAVFSIGKIRVQSLSNGKKKEKDKNKNKNKTVTVQKQEQDQDSNLIIIPILKEASRLFNETPKRRNVSLRRMSSSITSSTSSQFCSGDEITMGDSNPSNSNNNSNNNNKNSPSNSREISQILNIWRSGQSVIVHRFNYARHSSSSSSLLSSSSTSSSSSLVSEKEAYANEISMISALGLDLNLNFNVGLVGSSLTSELMRNKNQNTQFPSHIQSTVSVSSCSSGVKTKKKIGKNPNPTAELNNKTNNNQLKMRNQYGVFLLYNAYRNFSNSTNFTTNNRGNNHQTGGDDGDKNGNFGRVPNIF